MSTTISAKAKGAIKAVEDVVDGATKFVEQMDEIADDVDEEESNQAGSSSTGGKLSIEERKAKMEQLRKRMVRSIPFFHSYPNSLNLN